MFNEKHSYRDLTTHPWREIWWLFYKYNYLWGIEIIAKIQVLIKFHIYIHLNYVKIELLFCI